MKRWVCGILALAILLSALGAALAEEPSLSEDSEYARLFDVVQRYYAGEGGSEDEAWEAHDTIGMAALRGDAVAAYYFAKIFYTGYGVDQNSVFAFDMYEQSAKDGLPESMFELAQMYESGDGVKQDAKKATEWYKKAAERGSAEALLAMAQRDLDSLYSWLSSADIEDDGLETLCRFLIWSLRYPDDYEMSFAQAFDWYIRATEQDETEAIRELGKLYAGEIGHKQGSQTYLLNEDLAFEFLTNAADRGDAEAMFVLGEQYERDDDLTTALSWYQRAAELGNASAQNALGEAYHYAYALVEGNRDDNLAAYWYGRSAEQGDPEGMNMLGNLYRWGAGVPEDKEYGTELIRRAAEQNYYPAQENLGTDYAHGYYVPRDYDMALYWLTRAKENGSTLADDYIQEIQEELGN